MNWSDPFGRVSQDITNYDNPGSAAYDMKAAFEGSGCDDAVNDYIDNGGLFPYYCLQRYQSFPPPDHLTADALIYEDPVDKDLVLQPGPSIWPDDNGDAEDDEDCEDEVCSADPFCCDGQWGPVCEQLAEEICG